MFMLILTLCLAAVALAADNPDSYRYQQYRNNPFYNNPNPYNKYNNADYYQKYNRGNNYYNKDIYDKEHNRDYYNKNYNRYSQYGGNAGILKFENSAGPDGSYHYGYETENGISVEEQGYPRVLDAARDIAPVVVQGQYHYTSPEGIPVAVSYTADEFGYHPSGSIIPGYGQNLAYKGIYTTIRPIV